MKQKALVQALVIAALLVGTGSAIGRDSQSVLLGKQTAQLDRLMSQLNTHQAVKQVGAEFAAFAGSQENAEALVIGLVNSTPILLNGTSQVERHGRIALVLTHSIIIPPTKPMGLGDAYIALSMVKAQLAAADMPTPSQQQLQAALIAGSDNANVLNIGELQLKDRVLAQGVLTQRAAGMTWQEIAQDSGLALAPILEAMQATYQTHASQLAAADTTEAKAKRVLNANQTRRFGVVSASSNVALTTRAAGF